MFKQIAGLANVLAFAAACVPEPAAPVKKEKRPPRIVEAGACVLTCVEKKLGSDLEDVDSGAVEVYRQLCAAAIGVRPCCSTYYPSYYLPCDEVTEQ